MIKIYKISRVLFVSLLIVFSLFASTSALADPIPQSTSTASTIGDQGITLPEATPTSTTTGTNCTEGSGQYCLLAPLPGISQVTPDTSLGDYLNIIIKFTIGFAGVLAVVMLVLGGITYMGSESFTKKEDAKSMIGHAIGGLLLALASFLILNTINPNLVHIRLGFKQVSIAVEVGPNIDVSSITDADYSSITGKTVLSTGAYVDAAKTAADNASIPRCALLTVLTYESGAKPEAIGADENVPSSGVKSRRAFIASNKKYSGALLPANASLTDSSIKNDASKKYIGGKLQLDGRFSYGIGLTQVTVFPDVWNSSTYTTNPPDWSAYKDKPMVRSIGGHAYTPEELIDADKNLAAGAALWKSGYDSCGQNIEQAWRVYGGGSCNASNDFLDDQVAKRVSTYNDCVAKGYNNK